MARESDSLEWHDLLLYVKCGPVLGSIRSLGPVSFPNQGRTRYFRPFFVICFVQWSARLAGYDRASSR